MKPLVIAPSILSADVGRHDAEVRAVDAAGELRRLCKACCLDPWIEVDGGRNGANAWQSVEAGADALVAGSAVFGSADYAAAIAALRGHAVTR